MKGPHAQHHALALGRASQFLVNSKGGKSEFGWLCFLGFIAGFFQVGLGFIFITIGAKTTPSALVGIIMLTEAVLGPLWAWLFINETPPLVVLIGGTIVFLAVILQFLNLKRVNK